MTPQDGLDALEHAVRGAGIDVRRDELAGRHAVVAHWAQFRWRWFATRLHVFLIACPFSAADASKDTLDRFLVSAREYAVSHKQGLPRGFQTGVAVIAVAVAEELAPNATDWAAHPAGVRFAALAYPVSLDLRTRRCTRPQRMVFGAVYVPYLRRFVDSIVAPVLTGSQ